jgi:hypothetical protein
MELILLPLGFLYFLLFVFVLLDFLCFLVEGGHIWLARSPFVRYVVMIFTNLYVIYFEVCGGFFGSERPLYSPGQRSSIYVLLGLGMVAYSYCMHRKRLASPVVEVTVNCLLLISACLYGSFSIETGSAWLWVICPLPALLVFIMMLWQNHTQAVEELSSLCGSGELPLSESRTTQFCWFLLHQKIRRKFPVLLILCLLFLSCVVGSLLLFDQKSDLLVKAVTEI